jgi:hypothetical protein
VWTGAWKAAMSAGRCVQAAIRGRGEASVLIIHRGRASVECSAAQRSVEGTKPESRNAVAATSAPRAAFDRPQAPHTAAGASGRAMTASTLTNAHAPLARRLCSRRRVCVGLLRRNVVQEQHHAVPQRKAGCATVRPNRFIPGSSVESGHRILSSPGIEEAAAASPVDSCCCCSRRCRDAVTALSQGRQVGEEYSRRGTASRGESVGV